MTIDVCIIGVKILRFSVVLGMKIHEAVRISVMLLYVSCFCAMSRSFMIKVDIEMFVILCQEIEEVDTDEHYQPKLTIGILDVALKQIV